MGEWLAALNQALAGAPLLALAGAAGGSVGWVQGVLEWNQKSGGLALLRKATGMLLVVGGVYLIYRA